MRATMFLLAVATLALGLPGCTSRSGLTEEAHPLVGKKAPTFTATALDGRPFDLADHLGKEVVILDFWATWCGPCVMSLPAIASVARRYQDQGVSLYAVNLGDPPDSVRSFLKQKSLDIDVLLDGDSSIGNLYQAEAIPQTVIIARDGMIKRVHVGYSPDLGSELATELDQLVQDANATAKPAASHDDLARD